MYLCTYSEYHVRLYHHNRSVNHNMPRRVIIIIKYQVNVDQIQNKKEKKQSAKKEILVESFRPKEVLTVKAFEPVTEEEI